MTRVATVPAPRPASAWSMDGSPKRLGCAEMFEVIVLGDCSKLRKNQLDHRITKTNNISRNLLCQVPQDWSFLEAC